MRTLLAAVALLTVACGGPTPAVDAGPIVELDPACDNVDPTHCLLPWPSDHFRVDGQLALPAHAMPANRRNVRVDPAAFEGRDGFSLLPAIVTVLQPTPDEATLFGEDRIAESLGPDATAVIVNVATGERVPCFAELDRWPDVDPTRAPLYVRPAVRLAPGTRYAVGLRGLATPDGAPIAASPFFAALRDETPLEGSDVEARRASLEDVFDALEASGLPRAELQSAWGFTTATMASLTGDIVRMRDDLVSTPAGACTIDRVDEGEDLPPELFRRVHGTVSVPLYLVGPDPTSPEASRLARDADGIVQRGESVEVPFLALVPTALRDRVAAGGAPGRAIVYGHGILGSRAEALSSWMTEHANELEAVVFATDWWGMSDADLSRLVAALSDDFSLFRATTERLHQGVINVIALARAVRESCGELAELSVPLDAGGTAPSYDPSELYYYGNSQGSILGTVVAGLAPEIERFVLGVGGVGWTMLIKRSDAWRGFGGIVMGTYLDPVERSLLVAMTGLLWAPVDGATYAPHLLDDPLPGARARRLLVQIGIGDVAVSNVAAHVMARSVGLPLLVPSPEEPFGLTTAEGPADSAMTIFALDGVAAIPPGTRDPGPDTPTHNGVRSLPAARAQIEAFLHPDGEVIHPCDGACDPD